MRTTISLDSDVVALLEKAKMNEGKSFKVTVNNALRRGLRDILSPSNSDATFTTGTVDLGLCKLKSIDNIADTIALAEDENFK